ncbi:hypothetical protein ON010_g12760 [Phytophthora cinnamomi]|nr:hypothetical protein ON010_g12760 [Phytophthora cinnamomi]
MSIAPTAMTCISFMGVLLRDRLQNVKLTEAASIINHSECGEVLTENSCAGTLRSLQLLKCRSLQLRQRYHLCGTLAIYEANFAGEQLRSDARRKAPADAAPRRSGARPQPIQGQPAGLLRVGPAIPGVQAILPNRLNYLHWIEDLLSQAACKSFVEQTAGENHQPSTTEEMLVSGIDVGTGANCIYALLGATMNKWKFIATEIDSESYECAKKNVVRNHLETVISVKRTHTNKLLMEPLQDEPPDRRFHFVMCNPPFFDHMNEADTNPDASCMGSANENGVSRRRGCFYWKYDRRKCGIADTRALVHLDGWKEVETTEFFQGRTKRWGIAWTFSSDVMDDPSTKVLGKRKEAHRRQELCFQVPLHSQEVQFGCVSIQDVVQRIREFVDTKEELKLSEDEHDESEKESSTWLMFRLEQDRPNVKGPADNATAVRCAGRVEVLALENSADGFEVLVAFEEGERAAFWTTADMLQSATIRTGRQWRRKVQRQHQHSDDT